MLRFKFILTPLFLAGICGCMLAQLEPRKTSYAIPVSGKSQTEAQNEKIVPGDPVREMPRQGLSHEGPVKSSFQFSKQATVDFSSEAKDYAPKLMLREMPRQRAKKIETYQYPSRKQATAQLKTTSLPPLIKGLSFSGNPFSVSTPNDNDIAVSDSMLISVINTNVYVKNLRTNATLSLKSLAAITSPVNNKHEEFDPKVIYDPNSDRFIIVIMVGVVDTTSKIIVGFSTSNNPSGTWNLYTLPGDALNNGLWSDFPMIAITEKELFLSVNLLYNDSTWQSGFVETIVWQMKKANGYAGTTMASDLHSNIKYNGKPIRNLCPVKGGSKLYSPNMFLISNRNLASQNDTVFLVNITDTIAAPGGTLTAKALVSNQPYYFPADGRQTIATQSLATNDCRNLGAFYENSQIQYVHNTNNPQNNHVTFYHGVIANPQSSNPTVTGYLFPNDSMDFAYPNISYIGDSTADNDAIINFNHTSDKIYPGVSAVRSDGAGNYSPILRIQNGSTYVNLLTGSLERWGDYSGSQRKYDKHGEVWISGYYGASGGAAYPRAHAAWIAQLKRDTVTIDTTSHVAIKENTAGQWSANVFPNPATDLFIVEINLTKPEYLCFELLDARGRQIEVLLRDWVKVKKNVFSFSTRDLNRGIYFLKITGNQGTNNMKKVIVQ
jgi:hypothetical protein